ncbi:MAG: T9SS type A sorting domain-containing protein [Candidatus Eisenbacteria sp.]|nr:T9SS type A sorting domain-containing protein [Candidatus Eisenbacteria bacterium]
MKRQVIFPVLFILATTISPPVTAQAGVSYYCEDFTTTAHMNPDSSSAWWGGGELKLHPFTMSEADTLDTAGHAYNVALSGDYAYVADGDSLVVIDIGNPEDLVWVGSCPTPGTAYSVTVAGDFAFIADGTSGLRVIDISHPSSPADSGVMSGPPFDARAVVLAGNYAFIADSLSGMHVIDITTPSDPIYGEMYDCGCSILGVTVEGNYAFVCGPGVFEIVDIENPLVPEYAASPLSWPGTGYHIAITGNHAYVAHGSHGLTVVDIDVTSATFGQIVTTCPTNGHARAVSIIGNWAYVADGAAGLTLVNIRDPENPEVVANLDTPGSAHGLAVAGEYAYVANGDFGVSAVDIAEPVLPPFAVAQLDLPGAPGPITLCGDCAYIGDVSDGCLKVVDVSDPSNPWLADSIDTPGDANDVAVSGDYAYVADGTPSLTVLDVSDPAHPTLGGHLKAQGDVTDITISGDYAYISVASADAPDFNGYYAIDITDPLHPVIAEKCYIPGAGRRASSISVHDGYAYLADGAKGLRVVDILDCTYSTYNTPGLAHDVAISNSYAYIAYGESGLQIVDVSNPDSLFLVGSYDTPGIARAVVLRDSLALVADDAAGLMILSVADPASPHSLANYPTSGVSYDVAVDDTIAYVANHAEGMLVLDISEPSAPIAIAIYDRPYWSPMGNACVGITVEDGFAYIADNLSGLHIVDVSSLAPPDSGWACRTPGAASAVAINGGYAFVADGEHGMQVVDVTDRRNPRLVYTFDTQGYSHSITVAGDLAYFTDFGLIWDRTGLIVANVTDPLRPVLEGSSRPDEDGLYDPDVGNVVVSGDHAYVTDQWSNLQAYDLSDPTDLNVVGTCGLTTGAFGVAVDGDRAYVASYHYGFAVVDISDPGDMTLIGRLIPENTRPIDIDLSGDFAFVSSDEFGLLVIDIANPADPEILGSHQTPSGQNVAVAGDYAYLTDMESGLWIFSVFSRESKPDSNCALSTAIDTTTLAIARCQISTTPAYIDSIRWELSADGGSHWQRFLPGVGSAISHPGSDLLWKANLYNVGADSLVCDSLYIEWWYECPLIDAIGDIPDDQGGWMRVEFIRSAYDFENTTLPVDDYCLWRRMDGKGLSAQIAADGIRLEDTKELPVPVEVPEGLFVLSLSYPTYLLDNRVFLVSPDSKGEFPDGTWEMVQSLSAVQQELYAVAVPTYADTNAVGDSLAVFCVSAHRETPSLWYVSPPDSGFSIDNLTPQTIRGLCLSGDYAITWDASAEEDLDYYSVYVCLDSTNTEQANLLAQTTETTFILPDTTAGCYIFVTASDNTGLESPPSNIIFNSSSAPRIPDYFYLAQNMPNPFNPITEIAYGIPRGASISRVTMNVYDTLGRRVQTLVDLDQGPGTYSAVWDGRDHNGVTVASGIYFYRLTWNANTETKRMVLLK